MALRLLDLLVCEEDEAALRDCLDDAPHIITSHPADEGRVSVRVALDAGAVEEVLERLGERLGEDRLQALILELRATLPAPERPEDEPDRINIEELVASVESELDPSLSFVAWNVLASVIACLGLVRDNVAVVIGAMIVAPLLSPSVGLAVASTLGDLKLARRAALTSLVGLGAAFVTAAALGAFMEVDPAVRQIVLRTELEPGDFLLAGAAGVIAILATVAERSLAQVGVMVAVALLPPLATAGLLVGIGDWDSATSALLLLAVNVVGINLAGVLTLFALRVFPRRQGDRETSRVSLAAAVVLWSALSAALVAAVVLLGQRGG